MVKIMTENESVPAQAEEKKEVTEVTEGKYETKYIRTSKIRELFVLGDKKVRVSAEAIDKVNEFLDQAVIKGVQEIIDRIPKKTKGDNKGELKRITVIAEDFEVKEITAEEEEQ